MALPVDADDACDLPASKNASYDLTGDSSLSVVTPETIGAGVLLNADNSPSPVVGYDKPAGRSVKVTLAYLACALIWGTTWYGIRVCIGPGGYPTYAAAAWRFTISTIALAALWLSFRKKIKSPSGSESKWILIAGLLSGVAYGLLYASEEQISGGLAAVISATSPLMAALLAMRMKIEAPRKSTIIGSLVAIAGVAFVFHDRMQISIAQASAVGILLFNSLLNSSSNILMKKHGHHVTPSFEHHIFWGSRYNTLVGFFFYRGQCDTRAAATHCHAGIIVPDAFRHPDCFCFVLLSS